MNLSLALEARAFDTHIIFCCLNSWIIDHEFIGVSAAIMDQTALRALCCIRMAMTVRCVLMLIAFAVGASALEKGKPVPESDQAKNFLQKASGVSLEQKHGDHYR